MPRMFTSVLAPRRLGARDWAPSGWLAPFGALRQPGERRQDHKVDDRQNRRPQHVGQRGGDAQVAVPQPPRTRVPDVAAISSRRDARQLRVGVVHVEDFIAQDRLEDRAGLGIVIDHLSVDLEPAGRRFLSDVEEGEQAVIRLPFDVEIVEAVAPWQRIAAEYTGPMPSALTE